MSQGWTFKLMGCAPAGLCCTACFCPCFVMGKTHSRNKGEIDPSSCNSACIGMCFACHFGIPCVCLGIQRAKTRDQFGIEGNLCKDICCSLVCMPNVVIQNERESIARASGLNPNTNQPYKPVGGMSYSPQVPPPGYQQQYPPQQQYQQQPYGPQ